MNEKKIEFKGSITKENSFIYAGKVWDILTQRVRKYKSNPIEYPLEWVKITYPELQKELEVKGQPGRSVSKALHPLQDYCISKNLPFLTGLVVRERDGKKMLPSSGYVGNTKKTDYAYDMQKVLEYPWPTANPFAEIMEQEITLQELVREMKEHPDGTGKKGQLVAGKNNRNSIFKKRLLKIYRGKCAVCDIKVKDALDGAHIKPYSESNPVEQMSMQNGILLCANHHRLFDRGGWWFRADYTIHVSKRLAKHFTFPAVITLPTRIVDRPQERFINYNIKKASLKKRNL